MLAPFSMAEVSWILRLVNAPLEKFLMLSRGNINHGSRTMPWLMVFVISALLAGCERNNPAQAAAAPAGSSVKITAISPAIGEPLHTGRTVQLKVDVSYSLSVDSGQVELVVQDASGARLASNLKVIQKGIGAASMEVEFVVPKTSAVQVFTPLLAQGQNSTSTVDSRVLEVVN